MRRALTLQTWRVACKVERVSSILLYTASLAAFKTYLLAYIFATPITALMLDTWVKSRFKRRCLVYIRPTGVTLATFPESLTRY